MEGAMAGRDALFVLVAPYDTAAAATLDLDAVEALYPGSGSTHGFDAVVVERDADGQVLVVDQTRAHAGLAIGVAAALFPPIGVGAALALGAGGGSTLGAIVRHLHGDIPREELEQLAEMLEAAGAGLILVYDETVAEVVESTVSSESHTIIRASDVDADELVREARALTESVIAED
jgi:hypothetical protein